LATTNLDKNVIKTALKEALVETLQEQREFLRDVFAEVLEDLALIDAIHEGQQTKPASPEEIFRLLRR
jgi:hypothetical protein